MRPVIAISLLSLMLLSCTPQIKEVDDEDIMGCYTSTKGPNIKLNDGVFYSDVQDSEPIRYKLIKDKQGYAVSVRPSIWLTRGSGFKVFALDGGMGRYLPVNDGDGNRLQLSVTTDDPSVTMTYTLTPCDETHNLP